MHKLFTHFSELKGDPHHVLCKYSLQVTLLPAYSVEHGGHDEQARQSGAVQPCCDAFPFVIRLEVQQWTAHDAGNNPKLIK